MSDLGHKMTDEMIEELEKKITREYQQAYKDVSKKLKEYMDAFKEKDAEMWKKVKDGNMTQEAYIEWRKKKMLTGKRWKEMKQTLAEDLTKVNEKTRSIIGDYMPDAYALNHNYATFAVEKASRLNTSYTLYNRETVEHLLKDDEKLLPYPRKLSPTARKLAERADIIWNREHLNSQITQGVLQGESIPDIAKRLMKVVGMNRNVAVRNARTMMTSAENKGKEDAYDRLEEKGIELERQWVSTLDNRTRHSHRLMHGEVKDPETGLYSNGLKYPGDPDGEPEEVYNCRCSEIAFVKGHPIDIPKYSPKMTMSYEEWLGEHEEAKEAVSIEPEAPKRSGFYEPPKDFKMDPNAKVVEDALKGYNVYEKPLKWHEKELSTEELIDRIAGGDMTKGSCASLSFVWAGNRGGLDCSDFRGGNSQSIFSRNSWIKKILSIDGIKYQEEKDFNDIKAVRRLVSTMQDAKEYILMTGRHASVVRKQDGVLEYLELQSSRSNGFKPIENLDYVLRNRFGAKRSHTVYGTKMTDVSWLVDIDSMKENDSFRSLLKYINTDEKDQKRGIYGGEK